MNSISVFWFRRDLRIEDNIGLYHATQSKYPVLPIFIFDPEILNTLPKNDHRVNYIYDQVKNLNTIFNKHNCSIQVYHTNTDKAWEQIAKKYNVKEVYFNEDYEPYSLKRDEQVTKTLNSKNIIVHSYCDHLLFKPKEILKADASPYTVYTPFSKKWLAFYAEKKITLVKPNLKNLIAEEPISFPQLSSFGFEKTQIEYPKLNLSEEIISEYHQNRNTPSLDATTKLGLTLRFGIISIRKIISEIKSADDTFLKELIWREFYIHILYFFPKSVHSCFKPKYEFIPWSNNTQHFEAWKNGQTGYPIVDAGMRELNQTGFMHNRVRMITASFLTKHLLIDWRWGEAYFAEKLFDFELASNIGNWQWCASTGCDATPYFRIFNPTTQTQKFDSELKYIKKWIPELNSLNYPQPIVDHAFARLRAINTFKKTLANL